MKSSCRCYQGHRKQKRARIQGYLHVRAKEIRYRNFLEVVVVVQTKLEIRVEMADPEAEAEAEIDKIHL